MSLGFANAGFRVVGAIDSDPLNVRTHKRNLPDALCWKGDLKTLSGSQIRRRCGLKAGDLDVVFGGPPCQGFSEIGRQKKNDARNRLFHRFAVLVAELRPRYFVLENVRGLLFDRHGAAFQRFVRSVQDAGYEVVTPTRVLDAADFGVPQRRRRAFILGYKRGLIRPSYPTKGVTPPPTVSEAIGDLPHVDDIEELKEGDTYSGKLGVPSAYAAELRRPRSGAAADPTLTLTGCQRTKHKAAVRKRFDRTVGGSFEKRSRCYRLSSDGLAYTLRAGTGPEAGSFTAARPIHPERPRYITVREAARLHSFPDWFVFERAKWHALRQIGNSVPPLLARAVAEEILKVLIAEKRGKVADRKAS
jgi:DNA (cytosine-5)-methyltransferase 1